MKRLVTVILLAGTAAHAGQRHITTSELDRYVKMDAHGAICGFDHQIEAETYTVLKLYNDTDVGTDAMEARLEAAKVALAKGIASIGKDAWCKAMDEQVQAVKLYQKMNGK